MIISIMVVSMPLAVYIPVQWIDVVGNCLNMYGYVEVLSHVLISSDAYNFVMICWIRTTSL